MDGTFVKELADQTRKPQTIHVEDGEVAILPPGWQRLPDAPAPPAPVPIEVSTLAGVRDYLKANVDGLKIPGDYMLHVDSPTRVRLLAKLEDEATRFRRRMPLVAAAEDCAYQFGTYVEAETFVIALQTQFVATPERERLLVFVSSIRENSVRDTKDDGYGQEVSTAKGVHVVASAPVPNPVLLRPFRTFREVEQPESGFVLRLRPAGAGAEKPSLALFECDGGAWQIEAVARVAEWLRANTEGVAVLG